MSLEYSHWSHFFTDEDVSDVTDDELLVSTESVEEGDDTVGAGPAGNF